MRTSLRQLSDAWVVVACLLLLVIAFAAMAQQPSEALSFKNCPVPPGPWLRTTAPDGTVVCVDPENPYIPYWHAPHPGVY